jgi:hypothetical protein
VVGRQFLHVGHKEADGGRRSRAGIGVLVAVVAGAAVAAGIAISQSPSSQRGHFRAPGAGASAADNTLSSASRGSAENLVAAASVPELKRLSGSLGHPIYWAGPQEGTTYELTVAPDGRVYVRYLVAGAKPGSSSSDFLTIGTYPVSDPTTDLRRAARSPGSVVLTLPHGAVGYYDRAHPTSVYFADPGSHEEIETYDPSATVARALVQSGAVKPVH